jgi:hypothetical protein
MFNIKKFLPKTKETLCFDCKVDITRLPKKLWWDDKGKELKLCMRCHATRKSGNTPKNVKIPAPSKKITKSSYFCPECGDVDSNPCPTCFSPVFRSHSSVGEEE